MTPWVVTLIPKEDVEIFERIRKTIQKLPDVDLGENERGEKILLSCHILARATAKVFRLKYQDGVLLPNYRHSWVLTPAGHYIDLYPVAVIGGPILIEAKVFAVNKHYKATKTVEVSFGQFSQPWFRRGVRTITTALEAVAAQ